jgi:hypothetical protein
VVNIGFLSAPSGAMKELVFNGCCFLRVCSTAEITEFSSTEGTQAMSVR